MKQVPLIVEHDGERRVIGVAEVYRDGSVRSCRIIDRDFIEDSLKVKVFSLAKKRTNAA